MNKLINRIIGIATVGGTLASAGVLHRCLIKTSEKVVLTIVCSFAFITALTSGLVAIYCFLVLLGVESKQAALGLATFFLVTSFIIGSVAYCRLRKLGGRFRGEPRTCKTIPSHLDGIIGAFADGFLRRRK